MKYNAREFGKVAVLMGGEGSEREISLMSGEGVLTALKKYGINAHGVDAKGDICERLFAGKYNRVFIALHGTLGEDGIIQGLLECLKLPYTGSQVLSSALAMDKIKTKLIWQTLGLPTLPFLVIDENITFAAVKRQLGIPFVVKPSAEGSSIGVTRVTNETEFTRAVDLAKNYQTSVMAEPWIDEDEVTVGILGEEPLPVIRIKTPQGFYDYQAKYFSDSTQYLIPTGLTLEKEREIQNISLKAYQALGCRHWGRVDALMDKDQKIWLLEVNTIPGLTSHSLVPKAAKAIGIGYEELVVRILAQTLPQK